VQLALPGEAELKRGLVAGRLAPGVVGREPFPQLVAERLLGG